MNKLIRILALSVPLYFLSGCGLNVYDSVAYDPGYTNDYVYSVGYHYNEPYWGNNYYYYSGCGVRRCGYWGSYYY